MSCPMAHELSRVSRDNSTRLVSSTWIPYEAGTASGRREAALGPHNVFLPCEDPKNRCRTGTESLRSRREVLGLTRLLRCARPKSGDPDRCFVCTTIIQQLGIEAFTLPSRLQRRLIYKANRLYSRLLRVAWACHLCFRGG